MAVQQITHKIIKKFDEADGNFQAKPKPEKEVDGNKVEEDIYGEKKHTYQPDNGNLQVNEMMTGILSKADMSSIKSEEYKGKVNNKKDMLKALRHKKLYQKQMENK